ncbi:MAG: hypothetical protein U1F35_13415 [Steroidobacteraceae bacterium]
MNATGNGNPEGNPLRRNTSQPWVMSLLAAGFGLYLMGLSLGIFPMDPAQIHVPLWVLFLIGTIFLLMGWSMVTRAGDSRLPRLQLGAVLVLFLIVGNWIYLHRGTLPTGKPTGTGPALIKLVFGSSLPERYQDWAMFVLWDIPMAAAAAALLWPRRPPPEK